MDLFRLHAFTVEPSRTAEDSVPPVGGAVRVTKELTNVLNQNVRVARLDQRTLVDFQVDPVTRTNETRELVLSYAFGDSQAADTAADSLAMRLSNAMDFRSKAALFVLSALQEDPQRTVILWIFPRDEAFQFRSGRAGTSIQVLTDVFSQTSHLRKAALFQGRNLRNEFLRGRVLDFQMSQKAKAVADFWIARFLQCGFGLLGDAGTRVVARAFRTTFDTCSDPADQEQLFAAMMTLRRSPRQRWSPQEIADQHLSGTARQAFLDAMPNPETQAATFEFQTEVFDRALRFRVFRLDTGVFVSSPLTEVGRSVVISDAPERRLSCEGMILEDKVRTKHA